ncbi:AbrB/MazE/SpoVT family DNA-binding domain-containing protein [Candidatus Micrarchaeota archaeon]|nr:AbrB/MazE/SpoVT family DNA-binding domain-containing protein [Candidatus Micrarchaeota archaeon]
MDIELVKISSRGQFVLPLSMRKRLKISQGERFMVVEDMGSIVLKPLKSLKNSIEEELYLMEEAAKGWKEIKKGKVTSMSKEKFLKELSEW